MTCSPRNRSSTRHGRLAGLLLCCALCLRAQNPQHPLPIYIEDNHAGTFQFLATSLDLNEPHALVLIDAHSDSSIPGQVGELREGLRQVTDPEARAGKLLAWRRAGVVQSFDWVEPLMPLPLAQILWVRPDVASHPSVLASSIEPGLPPGFQIAAPSQFASCLPPDLPVVVSIDLDSFASIPPPAQSTRFADVWKRVVSLPRLAAISFAISRPWLKDDQEASRLLLDALKASLSLAHASVRFEPFGMEGPDRSEKAKSFYFQRKEPPRFDPETASPELRSFLLANADRLDVRLDPGRWQALLDRWRSDNSAWRIALEGFEPGSDGVHRPRQGTSPDLHLLGGPPGLVRRVTWIRWTPKAWSYNVLPELPSGKAFAGVAPPVMEYEATVLAHTQSLSLGADVWKQALPGPAQTGVLRLSAELETEVGTAHTARIEIRQGLGEGFHSGLAEQFGLPYVFGAGFLRKGPLRGPETGVGNDCANYLVYAWRRSGLRMPWCNPAQLKRHLSPLVEQATSSSHVAIPGDAPLRGLVVHLGSHVAALWEDREPIGLLGPEDLVVHHLGGAPEMLALAELLERRHQSTFDVFLGPSREASVWITVGGDLMPGNELASPRGLRERIGRADLTVANLEATIGRGGIPAQKRYAFQISPSRVNDLQKLGIHALSLANNHAGDFGTRGLIGTLRALDSGGLGHFGAGLDTGSAASPWYGHAKGLTVAFLAVSLSDPELLPAGEHKAGMAVLPRHQEEVSEAIREAHRNAQCVIVLPHWGDEGTTVITDEQRRWARWFVEQGADAVVGSGPHVIQTQECIAGVPVYYSLGNLWFRGSWPAESRPAGLARIGLDLSGRIVATRLESLPIWTGAATH